MFRGAARTKFHSSPSVFHQAQPEQPRQKNSRRNDNIQKRLRGGRAAGDVNIDGHDSIAPAHDRVRVMVVPATVRTRAHRNDPARLRHLVVNLAQCRRHLVRERTGDNHAIGLARRRAEEEAEPIEIVARRAGLHHLDGAARQTEGHWPERIVARPVHQVVQLRHHVFGFVRRLHPLQVRHLTVARRARVRVPRLQRCRDRPQRNEARRVARSRCIEETRGGAL